MRTSFSTFAYIAAAVLALGLFTAHAQAASHVTLSPSQSISDVGSSFRLTVSIDAEDTLDYGDTIVLRYPSDLISVTSFSYNDAWMPFAKNNPEEKNSGTLRLSAVYPGGFTGEKEFATVVFVANKAAGGTISVGSASVATEAGGDSAIPQASATFMVSAPFVSSGTSVTIRKNAADKHLVGSPTGGEVIAAAENDTASASAISSGIFQNGRFIALVLALIAILVILLLTLPTPLRRHRHRHIFGKRR